MEDDNINQLSILCKEFFDWLVEFKVHLDQYEFELLESLDNIEAVCKMSPQQYIDSLENDLPNDEFQFDAIDFEELEGEVE